MDLEGLLHGFIDIVLGIVLREEHLDRKRPARNLEDRHTTEELRELVGVHGGRGDDELEITPPRDDFLQDSEKDICVQGSLVRFIHYYGTVGVQVRIVQ